jgi:hypothetical protein
MPVYQTTGTLTGTIEPENVSAAQRYLQFDHEDKPLRMQQYLDAPLDAVIEFLEWRLHADGHNYDVIAVSRVDLSETELKQLGSEVSGQNSDGLGEGFEQQNFAETHDQSDEECGQCWGRGYVREEDEDGELVEQDCPECDGVGYFENDEYGMISFDWQTNNSVFVRVS